MQKVRQLQTGPLLQPRAPISLCQLQCAVNVPAVPTATLTQDKRRGTYSNGSTKNCVIDGPKGSVMVTQNKILYVHAIPHHRPTWLQSQTCVLLFYFCKAYSVLLPGIANGRSSVSCFLCLHAHSIVSRAAWAGSMRSRKWGDATEVGTKRRLKS